MRAIDVYQTSDGSVTMAFYGELQKRGAIGLVALNLFRAQKCSARAKVYRGGIRGHGSYRGMAYDRKNWSMANLCRILDENAEKLGIRWGWKQDPAAEYHAWVLYVDIPQGQVSFHSSQRLSGPDYPGDWDGRHLSAERIITFCDQVMNPV